MPRLSRILVWSGATAAIACALAAIAVWWALRWHASTVGDHLSARMAMLATHLGSGGRIAATTALMMAADRNQRVKDTEWQAVIAEGLHGSSEERIRTLDLLRSAFDYGRGSRLRGAEPPERERVFLLAAGPDADRDPAVQLAAHRCWWGNELHDERVREKLPRWAVDLDAIPSSPITPDGWRPDPVARLVLWRGFLPADQRLPDAVTRRLLAADDGSGHLSVDRRSQILAAGMLFDERGQSSAAEQGYQRAIAALFASTDWVADIWARDTTTACLLAELLWDRGFVHGHREQQQMLDRYLDGTISWCLAQAPARLPPWRAEGREVPASDLDRFAAWLLATRMVHYAGVPSAVNHCPPDSITRAATVTWPPTVTLTPDPQHSSPYPLRLVMSLLWLEHWPADPSHSKAWPIWREAIQDWMLRRQILTADHEGREGTWPSRGEVDATWETLFLGDCAVNFYHSGDDFP
jgi:hypothetical protein